MLDTGVGRLTLDTGDIGGQRIQQADVLGGRTSAGCRAPSQVLGGLSGREKPCAQRELELGPVLRTFAPKKRAVTKR